MIVRSILFGLLLLPFVMHCFSALVKASEDKEGCIPEHIHLSYGEVPSSMVVIWETQNLCSSEVKYAERPWNQNLVAKGTAEDISCSLKNCSALNFVHKVTLKNLNLSSTVYYRLINGGHSVGPFYFRVPSPDQKDPLKFFIASKSGLSNPSKMFKSLEETIFSEPHAALFIINKPSQLLCPVAENTLAQMGDLATRLPLMIGTDAESEDAECSQAAFPMPGQGWPRNTAKKHWYSMDVGLVHFIVYSAKLFLEKNDQPGKALKAWMLQDLKEANRRRDQIPWVVAISSDDPMYCQGDPQQDLDCARNDSLIRHGLEDIFYYFAVDLVLEFQPGVYERTWPHYKNVVVSESYHHPGSPVEIILAEGRGGGSSSSSPTAQSPSHLANDTSSITPADWSALRLNSPEDCYGHLSVVNASHLHFEWRSVTDKQEVVLDHFWLTQEDHGNFSLATLPHNVSDRINQSIRAMGGKPGTFDFISTLTPGPSQKGEGWSKYSIWFGFGCVGLAIFVGLGIVTIRSFCRRRRGGGSRRWREVDCQGSGTGHFYSMASDTDSDGEADHDFEIDMFERASKSESKLLTSY